jgi:hypothetical protein
MKRKRIVKVVVLVTLLVGIQIFRYETGYFPSKNMIATFESQVETKMTEYLINNEYDKEDIQTIVVKKVPKARKTFDVVATFENGNIENYIVEDIGKMEVNRR